MTKTRLDCVTVALRRLAVLSVDTEPSADEYKFAGDSLDMLFEEVKVAPHSMPFTWTLAEIPDAACRPLGWLLAVDIAPQYEKPAEPRSRAMARLREYAFPNDLPLLGDLDEDGTVSDAEAEAALLARFF